MTQPSHEAIWLQKAAPALILKNTVHKKDITLLGCRLLIEKYPAYAQKRGAKLETGKDNNTALKLRKPDIITRSENITTTEHKPWECFFFFLNKSLRTMVARYTLKVLKYVRKSFHYKKQHEISLSMVAALSFI